MPNCIYISIIEPSAVANSSISFSVKNLINFTNEWYKHWGANYKSNVFGLPQNTSIGGIGSSNLINGVGLGLRDNGNNDLCSQSKNGYSGGDKANGFNLSVNELRKFNLLK